MYYTDTLLILPLHDVAACSFCLDLVEFFHINPRPQFVRNWILHDSLMSSAVQCSGLISRLVHKIEQLRDKRSFHRQRTHVMSSFPINLLHTFSKPSQSSTGLGISSAFSWPKSKRQKSFISSVFRALECVNTTERRHTTNEWNCNASKVNEQKGTPAQHTSTTNQALQRCR